jgi:MFS family permease
VSSFRGPENKTAVFSLLFVLTIAGVNWFGIASIYSFIASDLTLNVAGLGVITTGLLVGIGLFQVPAGILTAKFGPRTVVVAGGTLASLCTILAASSSEVYLLAALRFLFGVGIACIYTPGMSLISSYYRSDSKGFGLGLYIASFSLGGIAGIAVWPLLAEIVSWRTSLALGGVVGLFSSFFLVTFLPKGEAVRTRIRVLELRQIFLNKRLLVLSLALLSQQVGFYLGGNFMVYYLEDNYKLNPALAGLLGSSVLISSLMGSPVGGRLYEKVRNPVAVLFALGVLLATGLSTVSVGSLSGSVFSIVLVGFAAGAMIAIIFLVAQQVHIGKPEYKTLSLAWINGIALIGSFWIPLLFSFLVIHSGYEMAWLSGGVASFLLILPILVFSMRPTART